MGDAIGGGAIRLILLLAPHVQYSAIMSLTLVCSAAAAAVASRLSRGYVQTLERNLRDRAVELDLSEVRGSDHAHHDAQHGVAVQPGAGRDGRLQPAGRVGEDRNPGRRAGSIPGFRTSWRSDRAIASGSWQCFAGTRS